jgi:hypothetical protein
MSVERKETIATLVASVLLRSLRGSAESKYIVTELRRSDGIHA